MVRPARVELATFWFVVRSSFFGACIFKRIVARCAGEMRVVGLSWATSVQRIVRNFFAELNSWLSIGLVFTSLEPAQIF
jgi:hypothetical protein